MPISATRRFLMNSWGVPKLDLGGCVLYLPFWRPSSDMTGNTVYSYDKNRFSCALTGTTWGSQGRTFDATDDGGLITHNVALNPSNMTIIAVINGTAWTRALNTIISKQAVGAGYEIAVTSGGKMEMLVSCTTDAAYYTGASGVHTLTAGTWYHVVLVWSQPTLTGYVNAVVDSGGANLVNDFPVNTTTNNLGIGYAPNFAGRQLAGVCGEIRIYNRVFSAGDVLRDFQITKWRY